MHPNTKAREIHRIVSAYTNGLIGKEDADKMLEPLGRSIDGIFGKH